MTYSSGGRIAATDYNILINASNKLNTVWGTGTGNAGYGQTAVSAVSASTLVTATQWTSLLNALNNALTHQSGTGHGITAATTGTKVTYRSTLSTSIDTAYTNRLTKNSQGTTVTGTVFTTAWADASTSATASASWGARATFSSADAARYFFNCGGALTFNCGASGSSTARSTAITNMAGYLGGVSQFGSSGNGGRLGTGGTATTTPAVGYWGTVNFATAMNVYNLVSVTSTTASYTSDTGIVQVQVAGSAGSYGAIGTYVDFYIILSSTSGANAGSLSFDDSWSNSITRSIDIIYPELSYLSNSWGTVSITSL